MLDRAGAADHDIDLRGDELVCQQADNLLKGGCILERAAARDDDSMRDSINY